MIKYISNKFNSIRLKDREEVVLGDSNNRIMGHRAIEVAMRVVIGAVINTRFKNKWYIIHKNKYKNHTYLTKH